jgi:hypothetical protein
MLKFPVALCLCRPCHPDIKRIKTDLNLDTQLIFMVWPLLYAGKSSNINIEHQLPLSGSKLLPTSHETDLNITPFQEISIIHFIFVF